jgi:hypothetical protein
MTVNAPKMTIAKWGVYFLVWSAAVFAFRAVARLRRHRQASVGQ